jgi:uncharacterized protein
MIYTYPPLSLQLHRIYTTGVVPANAKTNCDPIAAQCLVNRLNTAEGSDVWAYAVPPAALPSDVIANGILYRKAVVQPVNPMQVLTYTPARKSRDSLIQQFTVKATGALFTVAANHLKSKGSSCADVGDVDKKDGQANCSGTRVLHMTQLVAKLNSLGAKYVVALGDMNSYAQVCNYVCYL